MTGYRGRVEEKELTTTVVDGSMKLVSLPSVGPKERKRGEDSVVI